MNRNVVFNDLDKPDYIPERQATTYNASSKRRDDMPIKTWLVLLAGTLAFVAIMGFALVSFLSDLYQSEDWFRWLVQGGVALVTFALFTGLSVALGSFALALLNKARKEGLTALPGNVPVALNSLSQSVSVNLSNAYLDVKATEAQNSVYRNVTSYSPSINYGAGKAATVDPAALPAPLLAGAGVISATEWMNWIDESPHAILAAETGGGKSTTAKAILAPRIAAGEDVFVIDPHSSDWLGLPSVGGGENWAMVQTAMQAVQQEYKRRMAERDAYMRQTGNELPHDHFNRLTVLFDEGNGSKHFFEKVVKTKRGGTSPWLDFTLVLGSGARKVGISVMLLLQSANVEDIGLSGGMRGNFTRIGLDDRSIKYLIVQEEKDAERRKELFAALVGRDYPAAMVRKSQVYLLDRTGLDRYQRPVNAGQSAWQGWNYADNKPTATIQMPAATVTSGYSHKQVLDLLRDCKQRGLSRDKARELLSKHGVQFENALWSQV